MSAAEFSERMRRLGELVEEVEAGGDAKQLEPVRALVRAVLEVHREGLRDALAVAGDATEGGGERLVRALVERPSIRSLLLFHDLHPDALATRVERAVGAANDAARVEARAALEHLDHERAIVRISGGTAAAQGLLERTLARTVDEHAPDAELVVLGVEAAAPVNLIPVSRLVARAGGATR
ncbi:MAG TPA: hypothetical protein VH142_18185 [Polyangiaceae bacterium]|jgi:hypothetical protein|nr:hypothetical protein [Polyangiaceae bacterium]